MSGRAFGRKGVSMSRAHRLVLSLALATAACASSPSEIRPASRDEGFPVTVTAPNGEVEIAQRPGRIVSLSPTSTEMLFAIGAGDQVVAVDENSDYPAEAPVTDLSGYEPNIESIAGYEPDLVVASDDLGDVVDSLEPLDIPLILQPAAETLEDSYAEIEQLGMATGNSAEAAEVVASMESEIETIVESVPEFSEPPTYYHELDDTYFTATSETFIGTVYGLLGLRNIADRADEEGSGYPQLSGEYIIQADPDLIFLSDTKCCGQSLETVSERPGWDRLTAVRTGAVVELDDDVASRWGPRVVDFLRAAAAAVSELEPVG
jgi:iron complex transport system substrate-binding protein